MKRKNILGTIGIIVLFLVIAFLYSYLSSKSVNGQEWITPKSTGDTIITVPDSLLYTVGIGDLIFDNSLCVTNTLQFGGNSDAKITIDFDKDSILINYEGKLNEAGKIFIDFCREYGGRPIYDEILELAEEYEKEQLDVVVGFRYITDEGEKPDPNKESGSYWGESFYEVFNPKHRNLISYNQYNNFISYNYEFTESGAWKFIQSKDETYIRCEEVLAKKQPTLSDFLDWLEKRKK